MMGTSAFKARWTGSHTPESRENNIKPSCDKEYVCSSKRQEHKCLGMKRSETLLNSDLTILHLAAYHEAGRAVCVGSYGENGIVETVLHVLRHPGLQETLQDVRADVLFLKTRRCSFLAKVTTDLSKP